MDSSTLRKAQISLRFTIQLRHLAGLGASGVWSVKGLEPATPCERLRTLCMPAKHFIFLWPYLISVSGGRLEQFATGYHVSV